MNRYRYYTAESLHGSGTSFGFANDKIVKVWRSAKDRDRYFTENTGKNLSLQKIRRHDVTRYAANYSLTRNEYNRPHKFTDELWIIDKSEEDLSTGFIGTVRVGNRDDLECSVFERFYNR